MAEDQMLEEHRRIWQGFVRLVVWSTAVVVVTLGLLALFLV